MLFKLLQRPPPADAEAQLLSLYEEFKQQRAAHDSSSSTAAAASSGTTEQDAGAGEGTDGGAAARSGRQQPVLDPLLVVLNAVLNSLVEIGWVGLGRACVALPEPPLRLLHQAQPHSWGLGQLGRAPFGPALWVCLLARRSCG
jgi:hypothetical protein